MNYPGPHCDTARIGIALYGVLSAPGETWRALDLRPVLALKARVSLVRPVTKGECVGYGRSFVAAQDMRIAAVTIGYADGFPRSLSAKACVLIRGRRAPASPEPRASKGGMR